MRGPRFIYEFLKRPSEVGTVAGSSKFLARAMAKEIKDSLHVVEFGAGTGSVTTQILRHLPENGRLTCFEINPRFCKSLRKINDPRLTVINNDAKDCEKYVDSLDCVVSGLPLAVFDKSSRRKILGISSKSKRFIQFQYSPLLSKTIKSYFSEVKVKFVPLNFPPAFVYVCSTPDR
ncbi:MAG TPA: methyltransferase domain-containing protein [Phycisphaerales bacterium]|nr:methyltransferase domain-containing protein [Phycisphaerales bacterium]